MDYVEKDRGKNMNEALKTKHMETITHPAAVDLYEGLCAACDKREGGMTDPEQWLVADVARAEQIKQALIADIGERGVGQERWNGRQKYYQENKSVAQVRACAEQQRKHLAELRLTPSSRRASSVMLDGDEFASF